MKSNTKSSITLPATELEMVNALMRQLKAKTKVEVIRRGLALLKETTDRKSLRSAFKMASEASKKNIQIELEELNELTGEGLD